MINKGLLYCIAFTFLVMLAGNAAQHVHIESIDTQVTEMECCLRQGRSAYVDNVQLVC